MILKFTAPALHTEWKTYDEELTEKGKQHENLKHIFRKHVKPKKQHEIARLGSLVKLVSDETNVQQIVDVGSGVGHLSRMLSYAHELKTVSIDAKEKHITSARTFDNQLAKQLQKNVTKDKDRNTKDANKQSNQSSTLSTGPFYLASYIDFNDKKKFIETLSSYFTGKMLGSFGNIDHDCVINKPPIPYSCQKIYPEYYYF